MDRWFERGREQAQWETSKRGSNESLFKSSEMGLVLFACNKQKGQSLPQEIMLLEQPRKRVKLEHSGESQLALPAPAQEQLFLQKVDPFERAEQIRQMLLVSSQLSSQERRERRKEMFEASREQASEVLARRIIRVVKIENVFEGGGVRAAVTPVHYAELSLSESQEYYTLVRRAVEGGERVAELVMPQLLQRISYEAEERDEWLEDEYDSNQSGNSQCDYPEGESSEGSREGSWEGSWAEQEVDSEEMQDEETVYQRYLRRLRRETLAGRMQGEEEQE